MSYLAIQPANTMFIADFSVILSYQNLYETKALTLRDAPGNERNLS